MASRARNGREKTLEIGHGTCNADKPRRLGPLTRSEERVGHAQNDGPRFRTLQRAHGRSEQLQIVNFLFSPILGKGQVFSRQVEKSKGEGKEVQPRAEGVPTTADG